MNPEQPSQMNPTEQQNTKETVQARLGAPHFSSREMFLRLAETFQALGDSSRVQIVWALSHGELSVSTLCELLEMSQPAVSHHLRMLRNLHLVRVRREGRVTFYRLDDEHIDRLLGAGIEHVEDLLN